MKSFSEEWRNGTLELIYTKPVTEWQIVLAKYIANNLVTIIALFPTLVYYYSIRRLSLDPGLDEGATWGSYIGIVFLALVLMQLVSLPRVFQGIKSFLSLSAYSSPFFYS